MCTHSWKAQPLASSRNTTPYGHPTGVRDRHVLTKLCFAPEVKLRERKDGWPKVKLRTLCLLMVIEDHHEECDAVLTFNSGLHSPIAST
jgi:hypothetical protein